MSKIRSFFLGSVFMFVFVTGIPTLLSFPTQVQKLSKCNEKDTDEVIASIEKYIGIVSPKLIVDNLKSRLPEARNNNLNIGRIADYLLEAFRDNESAVFKISQLKEKECGLSNTGKIKNNSTQATSRLKRNYNLQP